VGADADRKIVLVTRRTRLEELIAKYHTLAQAKFYVEHLGADFSDYQKEHETYLAEKRRAVQTLEAWGRYQILHRDFLPNFIFGPADIVVALGQDGLVANTMKYLDGQPLVGLNPEPARWDGILLPFRPEDVAQVLPEVGADRRATRSVTMAEARLSDGQSLLAVNDLFIGPRGHSSALYEIAYQGRTELQSSSGLIVATGMGSTAWMKSIVTGSMAISAAVRGSPPADYRAMAWDSPELVFAVREPFPSRASQVGIVYGKVDVREPLRLRSRMPESGVIFSDGMEVDFLRFTAGMEAVIAPAQRSGRLVV